MSDLQVRRLPTPGPPSPSNSSSPPSRPQSARGTLSCICTVNVFTDTGRSRADAKARSDENTRRFGDLLRSRDEGVVLRVRARQGPSLFEVNEEERLEAVARMPTGIATYALGRGASRVSYNAPQYAAVGEDRQLRPGTERAPRQSLVEVGRERVAAHLASSGPGAAGAGAAGAAGAAATLPLQPRNTMPTPRAVHKPRGVPGQHGGSRSTVTPGVMAAASAHDVFSRQTEQTLAHAGLMRQQRAAGNLSPAFTSATFRGGAVAAASEPSAGVGAAARVPGGVAPAAHVPRSTRPATAGQGGAVRSVSDSIATLTGERRVQALLSLSDHQIENDDGLTPFIAEIVDERERLKVRLMEQEDARQRAQEASLGAPATAEIFPVHQAPPASAASPTNADVVALNAMLCEGFPHVSKELVSVVCEVHHLAKVLTILFLQVGTILAGAHFHMQTAWGLLKQWPDTTSVKRTRSLNDNPDAQRAATGGFWSGIRRLFSFR